MANNNSENDFEGVINRQFMERMGQAPERSMIGSYQKRFVAFIDILGFRNIIQGAAKDSPDKLFHEIVDSYWFFSATASVTIRLISDTVLLISNDDLPSSYISIANVANNIRNSFLQRGFLLRGAIAYGNHFESHGICISPTLIAAYELEQCKADVARIVCAQDVVDYVAPCVTSNDRGRRGIVGPHGFHDVRDQMPVADFDGKFVLEFLPDTLEAYFLRTGHHHDPNYNSTTEQVEHFRTAGPTLLTLWRAGLESAAKACQTDRHRIKANYLIEKWNSYIRSFRLLSEQQKEAYQLESSPLTSP